MNLPTFIGLTVSLCSPVSQKLVVVGEIKCSRVRFSSAFFQCHASYTCGVPFSVSGNAGMAKELKFEDRVL